MDYVSSSFGGLQDYLINSMDRIEIFETGELEWQSHEVYNQYNLSLHTLNGCWKLNFHVLIESKKCILTK